MTVRALQEDRDGRLWVATADGLTSISGGLFTIYSKRQGLPANDVVSLFRDETNDLWIGTLGGGMVRRRDDRFTTYSTAQGLPDDFVYSIIEDRSGYLWILAERVMKWTAGPQGRSRIVIHVGAQRYAMDITCQATVLPPEPAPAATPNRMKQLQVQTRFLRLLQAGRIGRSHRWLAGVLGRRMG
jgi:hypothetical protein